MLQDLYNELKGRSLFGGLYFFINPVVCPTDLDFIKTILIKDFSHFVSRGFYYNDKDDPISAHLVSVDGEKWRTLRTKLTPAFTSGKMKFMFPAIWAVAEECESTIDEMLNAGNGDLEIKELMARFTTDVIGTCAFGIECNSLKSPNTEFRKYGRAIFEKPRHSFLTILFLSVFPEFSRKLRFKAVADDVSEFFMNSLRETIRYREENGVQRSDFLNMMMHMLNADRSEDKLTFEEVAAECFVFFVAGFETSSTTMMYCLFELSKSRDIQQKARQEVLDVLKKHDGKCTYEALKDMEYLDRVIKETLRKYPPLANLLRLCTKDYFVESMNLTIAKGTNIIIPVFGIHHDPDIFKDPEVFDPERFTPEEIEKRHPLAYLPFGDGPRNCIGLRFGIMQAKVGLAKLLQSYQFSPCAKSTDTIILDPKIPTLNSLGGVWLNVKKIAT